MKIKAEFDLWKNPLVVGDQPEAADSDLGLGTLAPIDAYSLALDYGFSPPVSSVSAGLFPLTADPVQKLKAQLDRLLHYANWQEEASVREQILHGLVALDAYGATESALQENQIPWWIQETLLEKVAMRILCQHLEQEGMAGTPLFSTLQKIASWDLELSRQSPEMDVYWLQLLSAPASDPSSIWHLMETLAANPSHSKVVCYFFVKILDRAAFDLESRRRPRALSVEALLGPLRALLKHESAAIAYQALVIIGRLVGRGNLQKEIDALPAHAPDSSYLKPHAHLTDMPIYVELQGYINWRTWSEFADRLPSYGHYRMGYFSLDELRPMHSLADYQMWSKPLPNFLEDKLVLIEQMLALSGGDQSKFFAEYFSCLDESGQESKPAILQVGDEKLVLQGHHRLAALYLAVQWGILPEDYLHKIPVRIFSAPPLYPAQIVSRLVTGGHHLTWNKLVHSDDLPMAEAIAVNFHPARMHGTAWDMHRPEGKNENFRTLRSVGTTYSKAQSRWQMPNRVLQPRKAIDLSAAHSKFSR